MSACHRQEEPLEPGPDLLETFAALRDGELDEHGLARLEVLLLADSRARRLYLVYMDLVASLIWDYSESANVQSQRRLSHPEDIHAANNILPLPDRSRLPSMMRHLVATLGRMRWTLTAAASVTLVIVVGWRMSFKDHHPLPADYRSAATPIVAQLARTQEALWSDESIVAPEVGLASGYRLDLRDGMAEISFAPSGRVVMQGPATFTVASRGGELILGKLIVSVPRATTSFSVRTPQVTIASSGAQFGVAVEEDGAAQIHVFQGNIVLALADPRAVNNGELHLKAGEAMRISERGRNVEKLSSDGHLMLNARRRS